MKIRRLALSIVAACLLEERALALEFYVDAESGDDRRSLIEAQSAATPWSTINHALRTVTDGHTILVAPGIYREALRTRYDAVRLHASQGGGRVVVLPPPDQSALTIAHRDIDVSGLVFQGGVAGLRASAADGLRVDDCVAVGQATNGFDVSSSTGIVIEGSTATSASGHGIHLAGVSGAYLRNNLVYANGDWGVLFEGIEAGSERNLVAFNTIAFNGGAAGGGLRLSRTIAEIRDNLIVENAPIGLRVDAPGSWVHHNDLFANPTPIEPATYPLGAGTRSTDPLFTAPAGADGALGGVAGWADDDFSLRQATVGDSTVSPAVDAGSGAPHERDIDGSTASDGRVDEGAADLGHHRYTARSRGLPERVRGPGPGAGAVYHVDCESGDDARSKAEALEQATPWRTIARASAMLSYGENALVLAGTCSEGIETRATGVGYRAAPGVILAPPPGMVGVNVRHDEVTVGGFVVHSARGGVLAAKPKAGEILRDVAVRNLVVEPPPGGAIATNGIQVRHAERVTIESNVVRSARQQGILLKRVSHGYVRNNLVHGHVNDWGISIDGDSPNQWAPGTGNVAAFNTVWGNARGLRFRNASGEIRDNIVSENPLAGIKYDQPDAPWTVHHNDAWGSQTNYDLPSGVRAHPSNVSVDPRFVDPASGRFALRQIVGEQPWSVLVDAGSGLTTARDIGGSTASDGRPDVSTADPGHHSAADASATSPGGPGPEPTPTPTPSATPTPSPSPTPTPTPSPSPSPKPSGTPRPGSGISYYVDPELGLDERGKQAARNASTPWRSLSKALANARAGDIVILQPGAYPQQADFNADAVTLRGEGSLGDVVILPPAGRAGIYVNGFANARIENVAVESAAQGIVLRNAPGARVRGVAVAASRSNGVVVEVSDDAWIEGSIVTGSGAVGVKVVDSAGPYLRNNLIYSNAGLGVSITRASSETAPLGAIIAFNTLHANRSGIRLVNVSAEVRDNNITGHVDLGLYVGAPSVTVHHNNFASNGRDRDTKSSLVDSLAAWDNIGRNPRYVDPAGADGISGGLGWLDDEFHLTQGTLDASASPAVDAGSGQVTALDIDGSTASDGSPDTGLADIGFHYDGGWATTRPRPQPIGTNLQRTYYVDQAAGDDARSTATARRPGTPWKTIGRALKKAAAGDSIVVKRGVYAESLQVKVPDMRLIAEEPGGAVIRPVQGNGITIQAPGVLVDGFAIESAATGVSIVAGAHGAALQGCAVASSSSDGIRAVDVDGVSVQNSIVTGARGSGIRLKRSSAALLRNNLVYANGEWGVSIDASKMGDRTSSQNFVAESTIAYNQTGNLQVVAATATIRDNLVVGSPGAGLRLPADGVKLLHNGISGNARPIDPPDYVLRCSACAENRTFDPRFIDPSGPDESLGGTAYRDDDFRVADGISTSGPRSLALDAGSASAASLGVTGSTTLGAALDEGRVDLGFHYRAGPRSLSVPLE